MTPGREVVDGGDGIDGAEYRLVVLDDGDGGRFIPFRDETAGSTTYAGGRYTSIEVADGGGGTEALVLVVAVGRVDAIGALVTVAVEDLAAVGVVAVLELAGGKELERVVAVGVREDD